MKIAIVATMEKYSYQHRSHIQQKLWNCSVEMISNREISLKISDNTTVQWPLLHSVQNQQILLDVDHIVLKYMDQYITKLDHYSHQQVKRPQTVSCRGDWG